MRNQHPSRRDNDTWYELQLREREIWAAEEANRLTRNANDIARNTGWSHGCISLSNLVVATFLLIFTFVQMALQLNWIRPRSKPLGSQLLVTPTTSEPCYGHVLVDPGLNIRAEPDLEATIKGSMWQGEYAKVTDVQVTPKNEIWFEVMYPVPGSELIGWSAAEYMQLERTQSCRIVCPHCF